MTVEYRTEHYISR